jgi:cytochrome o ubiquinol oxidase subunit III
MMTGDAYTIHSAQTGRFENSDTVANQAFGFWIYIMSDLILFAAIFATFAVVGHNYARGPTGKELFDLPYLFGETMLLLFSSATCGLTLVAVHNGKKGLALMALAGTFLLGSGFISMEVYEFHGMILEGNGPERSAFLSAFFTLVGAHGTHVIFGLIWMAVMMVQIIIKGLTTPVQSRLMRLSMFWHFLDIVWIGVFTIVYLMGVI